MEIELKALSREAIPAALEKATRYRLLNEPFLAESICRDVLAADSNNQQALITLILALTDQFSAPHKSGEAVRMARQNVAKLQSNYDRHYYSGIICERQAKAKFFSSGSGVGVYELLQEAMSFYDQAEALHPVGNEDVVLRWNTCARIINERNLSPAARDASESFLE